MSCHVFSSAFLEAKIVIFFPLFLAPCGTRQIKYMRKLKFATCLAAVLFWIGFIFCVVAYMVEYSRRMYFVNQDGCKLHSNVEENNWSFRLVFIYFWVHNEG